jgi:hypothetical protein
MGLSLSLGLSLGNAGGGGAAGLLAANISAASARVGQTLTIDKQGHTGPHYVMYRRNSSQHWSLLSAFDPTTSYTLPIKALGAEVCVAMAHLDGVTSQLTGVSHSNIVGPILHAADPVGTTVTDAAGFNTAAANLGITKIILAAGATFDGAALTSLASLDRSAAPLTITTPQNNRAVITGHVDATSSKSLTFEGVSLYQSAAQALSVADNNIDLADSTDAVMQSCWIYGDTLTPSQISDTTSLPDGMNYLPRGVRFVRAVRGQFLDNLCQYVWQGLDGDAGAAQKVRRNNVEYFYFDNFRFGNNTAYTGQLEVTDNMWGWYVGLANEMTTPQAPHPDGIQLFAGSSTDIIRRPLFARNISFAGDTRTLFNAGSTQAFLNNGTMRGAIMINHVSAVDSPHTASIGAGWDAMVIDSTLAKHDMLSGGAEISHYSPLNATFLEGYARNNISNSPHRTGGSPDSASLYLTSVNNEGNADTPSWTNHYIGPADTEGHIKTLLALRPTATNEAAGRGAVLSTGYIKQSPMPADPVTSVTITPRPGGFDFVITPPSSPATITGYQVRTRDAIGATETAANSVSTITYSSSSASFSIVGQGSSQAKDIWFRAVDTNGAGQWSDLFSATASAVVPIAGPAITRINQAGTFSSSGSSGNDLANLDTLTPSGPDGVKKYVSIYAMQQTSGTARTGTTFSLQKWSNASSVAVTPDPAAIGAGVYTNVGGLVRYGGAHFGVPVTTARKTQIEVPGSASCNFNAGAIAYSIDEAITDSLIVSAGNASGNSCTLSGMAAGSRIIVVASARALDGTTIPAAFTWTNATLDQAVTGTGTRAGRFEFAIGEAQSGGSLTITATGADFIYAVAIPK